MIKFAAVTLAMLAATAGMAAPSTRYEPGQVWEYATRASDGGSLVKIQQIENPPEAQAGDPIYHVSIIGVNFAGALATGELHHLPVSRQTLDASVTRLSDSPAKFPDPTAGISQWRAANGGVFTIPLAEVVAFVEQALQKPR